VVGFIGRSSGQTRRKYLHLTTATHHDQTRPPARRLADDAIKLCCRIVRFLAPLALACRLESVLVLGVWDRFLCHRKGELYICSFGSVASVSTSLIWCARDVRSRVFSRSPENV